MLLPALLLTGLLVLGLALIFDSSLRLLDRDTFRLGETWTLANYAELIREPVYLRIALRTVAAGLIVTLLTLLLAFPYAYLMVRTDRAGRAQAAADGALPALLPGPGGARLWLADPARQAGPAERRRSPALGLPTVQLIYTYPGVLIGLVQYMLPFAVLLLAPALTAIPARDRARLGEPGRERCRHAPPHPPAAGEAGPGRGRRRRVHAHAHRLRHARDHGRRRQRLHRQRRLRRLLPAQRCRHGRCAWAWR